MNRLVFTVATIAVFGALFAALSIFSTDAAAQRSGQSAAADLEHGAALYEYWCTPCHGVGPGHPGTQSLQVKYRGDPPAVLQQRSDLTPEVIKVFVRQGVLSMPPYRKTEITDAELDDLAAYLAQAHRGQ